MTGRPGAAAGTRTAATARPRSPATTSRTPSCSSPASSRAGLVREIKQLPLKQIKAADQHRIGDERKSEERVQHAERAGGDKVRRRERRGCAPAQPDARRFELAAGGEDVAAARGAHRRRIAGGEDDVGERRDRRVRRAFVGRAGPRVERDQIDLGGNAAPTAAPARAPRPGCR